ncbi:lysosomal alpha-mannosidase-like [Styela clava]
MKSIVLHHVIFCFAIPCVWTLASTTCGGAYQSCNLGDPTKLNVHLVPHTHDDVGWLKTVDQYFYGANKTIQMGGVQYILDSVIPQLLKDPSRRFIYVEMAFFKRWWDEQRDDMRETVQSLVQQGRLEFILGGWCMNDEAATHYNAIIDQMSLGLQFLNDTFGVCARPRVAWQIDPFGHSREQASLFAQMGFDGLFFGRLDFADKELRSKEKRMEEIWRGSESLDSASADLLTGVNENGYGPPKGFCFDEYCSDDPIMDDPNLEDNNVEDKVKYFEDAARLQAGHFKTNHIMMTMGSDFQYSNAHKWYKNLDKLIKYVNAAKDSNISVFYSTPSCYLYALNQANKEWNVKTDDFFPYADSPHQFWTGYFTSRPALKGYVRESNKLLQVCKQMEALTQGFSSSGKKQAKTGTVSSQKLREAMGVAQHHDAVSGTEKQHVANDYAKRLYKGREVCKAVISTAVMGNPDDLHFCDYLNITLCDFTQKTDEFTVVVYNPLARNVPTYVRLPVSDDSGTFTVKDKLTGMYVGSQIVPVTQPTLLVRRNKGNADSELVFKADNIPPLGFSEFSVIKSNFSDVYKKTNNKGFHRRVRGGDVTIANEYFKVVFDGSNGQMKTIANIESGITLPVMQQMFWYNASMGNNISLQKSGAYVFRPNSSTPFHCTQDGKIELEVLQGDTPLVQEVVQKFSDWAWQVVRLYSGVRYIEAEWTIGPIPFEDGYGKEFISRFYFPLQTNGEFYTDANGREILKRKKDFRPTWTLNQSEPVAGNYYPVNSRIYTNDTKTQFTILTDRSQGGSSLFNGTLELMMHRRLFGDDAKGVGEPLNETGQFDDGLIVRGKHFILVDSLSDAAKHHRLLAEEIYMSPLVSFYANVSTNDRRSFESFPKSALTKSLPKNVHLLTLSTETSDGSVLIRLEHQFQKSDDPTYSQPVTVSLKDIFVGYEVTSLEELVLGANALKQDVVRLLWSEAVKNNPVPSDSKLHFQEPFDVTLSPMQIRTFRMRVTPTK